MPYWCSCTVALAMRPEPPPYAYTSSSPSELFPVPHLEPYRGELRFDYSLNPSSIRHWSWKCLGSPMIPAHHLRNYSLTCGPGVTNLRRRIDKHMARGSKKPRFKGLVLGEMVPDFMVGREWRTGWRTNEKEKEGRRRGACLPQYQIWPMQIVLPLLEMPQGGAGSILPSRSVTGWQTAPALLDQ